MSESVTKFLAPEENTDSICGLLSERMSANRYRGGSFEIFCFVRIAISQQSLYLLFKAIFWLQNKTRTFAMILLRF